MGSRVLHIRTKQLDSRILKAYVHVPATLAYTTPPFSFFFNLIFCSHDHTALWQI
jgi:hypothetical protein